MTTASRPTQAKPASAGYGFLLLMTGVAALGGLLFGYDTAVISGAIEPLAAHFHLGAESMGWAASSALTGCVLGAIGGGCGCDTWGRHRFLLLAGIAFFVSAAGSAAAGSLGALVAFRILGGFGIGAASVVSPLYIAESSPARFRGALVTVNQLAIVFGMLLIYLVNYQIARGSSAHWIRNIGWRWMFASGMVPAALLLLLLALVPETARFLLLRGRIAEAERVAKRTGAGVLDEILAAEKSAVPHPARRGVYVVGIGLAVLQQVTGINVFLYYAPLIFASVSNSRDVSLEQTVAVGAVNVVFTIVAMVTVDRAGRKPLLIAGAAGMALCLAAMGWAVMHGHNSAWLLLWVLTYVACFAVSVGPVTWILLSELFPSAIRGEAMAVSTAVLWAANFVVSQTFPMLDQNAALVARFGHAFPFFLYAGFCLLEIWFVSALVPETKNKRLEEIAQQWSREVWR